MSLRISHNIVSDLLTESKEKRCVCLEKMSVWQY